MAYALQAGKRAIGLLIGITATLAISVAFVGRVIDVRPFVIDCLCVTVAEYGMSTPTGDLPCLTPNCLPPRVHLVRPRTGRVSVPVFYCPPDPDPQALCDVRERRERI